MPLAGASIDRDTRNLLHCKELRTLCHCATLCAHQSGTSLIPLSGRTFIILPSRSPTLVEGGDSFEHFVASAGLPVDL
jgi:hypothetical protein